MTASLWVLIRRQYPSAGAAHIVKLLKSEGSRLAPGPGALLAALLACELPPPGKARYPPVPPAASLKISSVFCQLGAVDLLRARLGEAADAVKAASPDDLAPRAPPLLGLHPTFAGCVSAPC